MFQIKYTYYKLYIYIYTYMYVYIYIDIYIYIYIVLISKYKRTKMGSRCWFEPVGVGRTQACLSYPAPGSLRLRMVAGAAVAPSVSSPSLRNGAARVHTTHRWYP